jgi:DNA-binding MarR family transcriptional regulator
VKDIGINDKNSVAHKLLSALGKIHKAQWQQSMEGNKPSEMTLMLCIAGNCYMNKEGPKVSELSRQLGLMPPTVTQLINSLEAKNMVERQPDASDRRAVRVILTEEGIAVTQRAKSYREASLNKLVEYLGEEESNHLAELLLKVHEFVQQNPPPDFDRLQQNGDDKLD